MSEKFSSVTKNLKQTNKQTNFTTPLPNSISEKMMSRLILTLLKHVPGNWFLYLYAKPWKVLYRMQVFQGTTVCYVGICRRKSCNICYFSHYRCFLFNVIFFIWKNEGMHAVKIVPYCIIKMCKNCKYIQYKKSHWVYIFNMCSDMLYVYQYFSKSKL